MIEGISIIKISVALESVRTKLNKFLEINNKIDDTTEIKSDITSALETVWFLFFILFVASYFETNFAVVKGIPLDIKVRKMPSTEDAI